MKKLLLAGLIALLASTSCKKSNWSHLYQDGTLVQLKKHERSFGRAPFKVDGIYWPSHDGDPNYYYLLDADSIRWKNVPDYNLEDYRP